LKAFIDAKNTGRKVAAHLVESIRSADPPARFLTIKDAGKYVDIGDEKAITKV